jgi:hypothetical protein
MTNNRPPEGRGKLLGDVDFDDIDPFVALLSGG